MARYTGPVCKLCRREGEKLFLKGSRCLSPKCSFERRSYPPGAHGRDTQFRRGRASDFALQLREKQKARRIYGVLERQFRRYFRTAQTRSGLTGANLLMLLESRLDNVIYRLGLADSRNHARQLVQHGHFMINGVKTNIPSYLLRPGDEITVRDGSRNRKYFREINAYVEARPSAPEWCSLDLNALKGTVVRLPERREIDSPINEQLIVEYYSR
ncbi:MAG: 30S ribosomal protein S4 [Anaerolineales bacterium]|nr:30S ribosomal protein S4 [Anaerolineales bacterium]